MKVKSLTQGAGAAFHQLCRPYKVQTKASYPREVNGQIVASRYLQLPVGQGADADIDCRVWVCCAGLEVESCKVIIECTLHTHGGKRQGAVCTSQGTLGAVFSVFACKTQQSHQAQEWSTALLSEVQPQYLCDTWVATSRSQSIGGHSAPLYVRERGASTIGVQNVSTPGVIQVEI